MKYIVKEGIPLTINVQSLTNKTDWTFQDDKATHSDCNTDSIELLNYNIKANTKYTIGFEVTGLSTGYLEVSLGGETVNVTTNGVKTYEITSEDTSGVKFTSNANLTVSKFSIVAEIKAPENTSESTITWSEALNRWIGFRSYSPESGFSMFTDLFTYYNGLLYRHSSEIEDRNNFYGNQYNSIIEFVVSSPNVKNYQSIAIHSNKLLVTTEDGIRTQLNQLSELIEEDFEIEDGFFDKEGIYYANFLRAKPDLMEGERLKGRYIVMKMIDTEPEKKLQLLKINIKSTTSTPNE